MFAGDTLQVARRLLGTLLVSRRGGVTTSGIIVEVESYLHQDDPASHSFRGPTKRNQAMFMAAGTLYVYSIHAKFCLNVVTEPAGIGAAVLIRALQPWCGIETMQARRGTTNLRELCTGPARLCQALDIDLTADKTDLVHSESIYIQQPPRVVTDTQWQITESSRIGISRGQDALYRLFIDGHTCVSGLARSHRQKRGWLFKECEASGTTIMLRFVA